MRLSIFSPIDVVFCGDSTCDLSQCTEVLIDQIQEVEQPQFFILSRCALRKRLRLCGMPRLTCPRRKLLKLSTQVYSQQLYEVVRRSECPVQRTFSAQRFTELCDRRS